MKWMWSIMILIPMRAIAQWEPIGTDRPDRTEAAMTIPVGDLQVESGFQLMPRRTFPTELALPQILIRLGIGDRLELRAEFERTQTKDDLDRTQVDWSPPEFGMKVGLGHGGNTDLVTALLVDVGVPRWAGENDAHPFAGITLAVDRDIGERWSMGANLGMSWNGQTLRQTTIASLTSGLDLSRRAGVFAELYSFYPEDGIGDHHWDCGATWAIAKDMLVDASFGNSFEGQDWFIGAGFSFRVGVW